MTLESIVWPDEVAGCAAVVERLVLPPGVDDELPDDPAAAEEFAREHPLRQEVRIVAGATRAGATYCALRLRAHDDDLSVVDGTDLVPGLLELLRSTLEGDTSERPVRRRAERQRGARRRRGAVGSLARADHHRGVLVVLFVGLTGFASFWTERLWFDSAGSPVRLQHAAVDPGRAVPGLRRR